MAGECRILTNMLRNGLMIWGRLGNGLILLGTVRQTAAGKSERGAVENVEREESGDGV